MSERAASVGEAYAIRHQCTADMPHQCYGCGMEPVLPHTCRYVFSGCAPSYNGFLRDKPHDLRCVGSFLQRYQKRHLVAHVCACACHEEKKR